MDINYFIDCVKGVFKPKYLRIWKDKYNTEFTPEEKNAVLMLLAHAGITDNINDVRFYWNDLLEKDAIGCFYPFTPDAIYVTRSFKFYYDSEGFKKLIGPIGHELIHRQQLLKLKLLYFICAIPIIRNLTIEVQANRTGEKINKYYKIPETEWL